MSLASKVTEQRKKLGMNQKQLAEACALTQATISRIESGDVQELKSEALKRLALALGVTTDYLIGKTKDVTPSDTLASNPEAQYIFRGYEKLSQKGREQLKDFVQFLEKQEKLGK